MKTQKIIEISLENAWILFLALTNKNVIASLVSETLVKCTKKCRITSEIHGFGEIKKRSEIKGTQLNSDYFTRYQNKLIKNEKSEEAENLELGVNNMPIDFEGINHVVGYYDEYKTVYKWNKDTKKNEKFSRTFVAKRKVIVHYPNVNTVTNVLTYIANGIEMQKAAFGKLDIFPKYYDREFKPEIRKMYFENLKGFSIDGQKYAIV